MSISFEDRFKNLITELEIGSADDVLAVTPLTGGVSSDIARVDLGNIKVCVKFALEQLKVAEEWHAKVERNQAEYRWLVFASSIVPEATPILFGNSDVANGFAMEFIEGDDVYLWKTALLQGQTENGEAGRVGHILGLIHSASATSEDVRRRFQNQEDFYALRQEPYLSFTATQHPDISDRILGFVDMLNDHQFVLIHGDVSPKNIIFKQGEPVFLDAECATIGDPSFDISFCLNHLILKAVHIKKIRYSLLTSVKQFWTAYNAHVTWEPVAELEKRVCKLLPALMLARIDGKSPVEYLGDSDRTLVRSMAISLIESPEQSLTKLIDQIIFNLESK